MELKSQYAMQLMLEEWYRVKHNNNIKVEAVKISLNESSGKFDRQMELL